MADAIEPAAVLGSREVVALPEVLEDRRRGVAVSCQQEKVKTFLYDARALRGAARNIGRGGALVERRGGVGEEPAIAEKLRDVLAAGQNLQQHLPAVLLNNLINKL